VSNQVVVNIKIHNRFYKIKVDADKESYVRKTAEDINKQLEEFQKKFKGRDTQDYMAMTLIARLTEEKKETVELDFKEVLEEIQSIEKLIS
jgi:cell division protein ZapA (FtsZ GTPase activity inhibitor)